MTEFDDMVAAERRRLDEQAAAQRRNSAADAARQDAWERDESREWQKTIGRIQELFTAATVRLQQEGAKPLPVLEHRAPRGPLAFDAVNRTIITGYRWNFEVFALDKRCRLYKANSAEPLMTVDRRSEWSIRTRTFNYLLKGQGVGGERRFAMLNDKSLLRTGLKPDDLVFWGNKGDCIELDLATATRNGRIHCFGKADDGTPLMLRDASTEPLELFMARATARILAQ